MSNYSVAFQVLVFALLEGPQSSKELRRAIMGPRYADTKGSPNTNYNRHRSMAVEAGIMTKNAFGLYELGDEGRKLKAWADENGVDLSLAKTQQRITWEAAHPETSSDA